MRSVVYAMLAISLAHFSVSAADDNELRDKVIAAVKESQNNSSKVVEAARLSLKALDQFEALGKSALAAEMKSYVYWCRKRMNPAEVAALRKELGAAGNRLAAADSELNPMEVEKYFESAEAFAKTFPGEHFLIAIRFLEIAERFKGTARSLQAQERSLDEMKSTASSQKPARVQFAADPANALVITIQASDDWGYRLGKLPRGEQIFMQYVEGAWKGPADPAPVNPDSPAAPERLQPVILDYDPVNVAYKALFPLQPNSQQKFFGMAPLNDLPSAMFVIKDRNARNSGSAAYRGWRCSTRYATNRRSMARWITVFGS